MILTVTSFRQDKAKIVEKAEFTGVNEHFEPIFNVGMVEKTTRAKASKFKSYVHLNRLLSLSGYARRCDHHHPQSIFHHKSKSQ